MEELIEPSRTSRPLTWPGGLFLLALAASTLADRVAPLDAPGLLGQERMREKQLIGSAHLSDGSLALLVEHRVRLSSRVRRRVAPYWIAFLARYLGSVTEDVVIGREDWLFLRERALSPELDPARAVALARHLALAMDRRFSSHGTTLVFLPIPRKAISEPAYLPVGFELNADFDPRLDGDLIDGLREDGAEVVDAGRAWSVLPDGATYLPFDTHWSAMGQRSFAAEVGRLYPAPDAARVADLVVTRRLEPEEASLLEYIGLGESGAARMFRAGSVKRVWLAPEDIPRLDQEPWAALVGTSLTADFDFHAYLSLATHSRIAKAAMAATPFGTALAVAIAGCGDHPLPGTIFVEFPVHAVFALGKESKRVQLGITQVFALLPPPVAAAFGEPASPAEDRATGLDPPPRGRARLRYGAGEVLSSGDGALAIQVEIECEEPSRWQLRCAGMGYVWKAMPGMTRLTLPIVEAAALGRGIELLALDAGAMRANVSMGAVIELPPWEDGDGADRRKVGRNDLARVKWRDPALPPGAMPASPASGPVVIRASGRTPEGRRVQASWTFHDALAQTAVLGLTRFRGGTLDELVITGRDGEVMESKTRILTSND